MSDILTADGSTTKHRRFLRRALQNWAWPLIRDVPHELLRTKLIRFFVSATRFVWYVLILRRFRTVDASEGVARTTVRHNIRGVLDFHVERSVCLIYPVVMWASARRISLADQKVLTIGPPTEGEILNLVAHGFRQKNITGLDPISYSPTILFGDMHKVAYADASFDVIVAGWVVSYSDRKDIAAAEITRVAKPGAIGIEWGRKSPEQVAAEKTGYIVGSAKRLPTAQAILDLFGDRVDRAMPESMTRTSPMRRPAISSLYSG